MHTYLNYTALQCCSGVFVNIECIYISWVVCMVMAEFCVLNCGVFFCIFLCSTSSGSTSGTEVDNVAEYHMDYILVYRGQMLLCKCVLKGQLD